MRILQFPFIGISHPERAYIATAIMSRYGGKPAKLDTRATEILTPNEITKAEVLGRALLLGHRFSASVPEILKHARLRIDSDMVRLEISQSSEVPDSDTVRARLLQLAKVLDMDATIEAAAPQDGPG